MHNVRYCVVKLVCGVATGAEGGGVEVVRGKHSV